MADIYGQIKEVEKRMEKTEEALLQQFGGPIPVYIDEKQVGEYTSVLPLYRVEINFDLPPPIQVGRTLKLEVIHTERLYDTLKQYAISIIRKEF